MYEPKLNVYQRDNSGYLVFEDTALKYVSLSVVTTATLHIINEDLEIDVTLNIANENGIHPDSPYNGYSATITSSDLGLDSGEEIPDAVYDITYTYDYVIEGLNEQGNTSRRFALYAIKERQVYALLKDVYKHYKCDKPWESTYVRDALMARALLKSLETSAFLGFQEDYENVLETLDNILQRWIQL